jgi:hypothetical protein
VRLLVTCPRPQSRFWQLRLQYHTIVQLAQRCSSTSGGTRLQTWHAVGKNVSRMTSAAASAPAGCAGIGGSILRS